MGDGDGTHVTIGARRSRIVAVIWLLVAIGWFVAAALLWIDQRRLSPLELPAGIVALGLTAMVWRQRVIIDRRGIETIGAMSASQIPWAVVKTVEAHPDRRWRPMVSIIRKGTATVREPIRATAGLSRRQRDEVVKVLSRNASIHDFELVFPDPTPEPDAASRPEAAPQPDENPTQPDQPASKPDTASQPGD